MDRLRTCVYCGKEYSKRVRTEKPYQYRRRKYCSNKCKMLGIARTRKPREPKLVERKCKQCNNITYVRPCHVRRPFCNRDCMTKYYDENLGGENHWNWQGGITKFRDRDNDSVEYKQWRKSVFKRDGYQCVKCGNSRSGQLIAHHILEYSNYPLFRYDIDNGKTVCEDCHKEIHYGIKIRS